MNYPSDIKLAPVTRRIPRQSPREEARESRVTPSLEGAADGAGAVVLDFGAPPPGYSWLVERMMVAGGGSARVYVVSAQNQNLRDYAANATLNVGDEASPFYVESGQKLLVAFTGAGAGTICMANAQIRQTK